MKAKPECTYVHRLVSEAIQQHSKGSLVEDVVRTYVFYIGMKQYFTHWKFNWSMTTNKMKKIGHLQFVKRPPGNRKHFYKVVEDIPDEGTRFEIITSAMIQTNNNSIADIAYPTVELADFHISRMKNLQKLNKLLVDDIDLLERYTLTYGTSLAELLTIKNGAEPGITMKAEAIGISLETMAALDTVYHYTENETLSPKWDRTRLILNKYGRLLEFETDKFVENLKKLDENLI